MYCLAFAEREHGSDLTAIETCGEIIGDQVVVTGMKSWVTGADGADAALVLCRTAPDELSCVLVPLPDEAVELRPIRVLSGESDLFELHFDGARAPLTDLCGERGDGLQVALRELSQVQSLDLEREFWDLVATARDYRRNRDPHVRQQLAWAYTQVRILPQLTVRNPELAKVLRSEYHRRLGEIALDVVDADGLLRPDGEAYHLSRWQHAFLASRADTIATRTTELQRGEIAEHLLGLPG